jgi:two-component system cell cycle response regulator DivK
VEDAARGPESVLIIDDEPLNRKLIRTILGTEGIQVLEAETAERGLALAQSHAPRLILLDLRLPGMSGLDALSLLKSGESTGHIPVLILSAGSLAVDDESFRQSGAAGLILKPFTREELLDPVWAALAER